MKLLPKLALSGLLAGSLSLLSSSAQAQVTININPPSWGPSTPTGTEYYYIPEAKSYYDLRAQRYIVLQNGQWVRVANLSGYDQRNFHPVVLDYRGSQPWSQYSRHRQLYPASLPPGQVKRLESGKGLPPGQAKKVYGGHLGNGNGKGNGKGKH